MSDTHVRSAATVDCRSAWLGCVLAAVAFLGTALLGAVFPVAAAGDPYAAIPFGSIGYRQYWDVQLDLGRGGMVSRAYLVDDTIYVLTEKGDVHAVHAGVGLSRWSRNLASSVDRVYRPTHFVDDRERGLSVFTTSARTLLLDRYTGETAADLRLGLAASGSAIGLGSDVFFGSSDGHVYAMTWDDPQARGSVQRWRVMAGGPVTAAPVLIDEGNTLVFASQGGSVFSCTSGVKTLRWSFDALGPIFGDIHVGRTRTYLASADRSVYCIGTNSGVERWRVRFPEPLYEGPVVAGDVVYQYCPGVGIAAIGARTGKPLWRNADAREFLCRQADRVHLLDADNNVLTIDDGSGEVVQSIELPPEMLGIVNKLDDTIFLVSDRGRLLCAKTQASPYLRPDDLARARRDMRNASHTAHQPDDDRRAITPARERAAIDPDDPLRSKTDGSPLGGDE